MPETLLTRDCRDHGAFTSERGCCPKCAEEIANGGPVRTVDAIMNSSLEALARRLK